MSINKQSIIKDICESTSLSSNESAALLEAFLSLVITEAKSKRVKLNCFGTFNLKKTLKRIGRNPKTMESYIIPSVFKLKFVASNKLKSKLN